MELGVHITYMVRISSFLLMTFLIKELSFLKKEVAESESCFFIKKHTFLFSLFFSWGFWYTDREFR